MTTFRLISDLEEEVAEYVPQCPRARVLTALRRAARQFAQESRAWVEELPVIDVVAYQLEYNLLRGTETDPVSNGTFATGDLTGWSGAGWAYNAGLPKQALHSSGTTALSQTISPALIVNDTYLLTFTVTSCTTGTVTPGLGGVSGNARSANGTYTEYLTPTAATTLTFTPTTGFNGGVSGITLYRLPYNFVIDRLVSVVNESVTLDRDDYDLINGNTLRFTDAGVPATATDTISAYSTTATYAVAAQAKQDGKYWDCITAISAGENFTQSKWSQAVDGMYVKVLARPRADSAYLPEWMIDRWGEGIAALAAYTLLMVPKKPWTDPMSAAERRSVYRHVLNMASGDVNVSDMKDGPDSFTA